MTLPSPLSNEVVYTRIFTTLINRQSNTITFRRLSKAGEPMAAAHASVEDMRLVNEILTNPEYDQYFLDRKKAVEFFGGPEALAASMTQGKITTLRQLVDYASIVVMHSALDAALTDLCRLAAALKASDWEARLAERTVKLGQLRDNAYQSLLNEKLADYIEALAKDSLLKRADALFAACRPASGFSPLGGYAWDRAELQRLDQLRHDLAHGRIAAPPPGEVEKDIEFFLKTGLFFWGMLNATYGIKMDPWGDLQASKTA
jgi:hypothetical protein